MLEMRNWSEAFTEEYRKEKPDWSQYSEAFAEEREAGVIQGREEGMNFGRLEGMNLGRAEGFQKGIDHGKAEGKAEGFMDGMKAMARKMLARNHPLREIVEDTGLSESEILHLRHG